MNKERTNLKEEREISLAYVPEKFINQELVNKYFDKYQNTNGIPDEYITKEMIEKYIDNNMITLLDFYTRINNPIISDIIGNDENLFNKFYDKCKGILGFLPKKFHSNEIINAYWNNYKVLHSIPKEYITQEMVSEYWNKEHNLRDIPEKFITQEMVDEYLSL